MTSLDTLDEEQPVLLPPQRPGLSRSDAAHQQSPLFISAYAVVKTSSPTASETSVSGNEDASILEEVSLEDALDHVARQYQPRGSSQNTRSREADAGVLQKQQHYWIDVEVLSTHAGSWNVEDAFVQLNDQILNQLLLSSTNTSYRLLRRHLQDPTELQTPQVLSLRDAALIVTRVLGGRDDGYSVRHAAAVCLPTVVVTVTSSSRPHSAQVSGLTSNTLSRSASKLSDSEHTQPTFPGPNMTTTSRATVGPSWGVGPRGGPETRQLLVIPHKDTVSFMLERELPHASVSGCILLWTDFHLSRTAARAHRLRRNLFRLVERSSLQNVDDDTDTPVEYSEIAACRDQLLKLSSVAEEQNECIGAVVEGDAVTESFNFSATVSQGMVNVLKQSAASTERLLLRMEKRADDLERAYDARQQNRINHRLNVLTIFSAVFMPLTLMAGVWGMNFTKMPELEKQQAYYWALASMAAVAIMLLLFFYRNGWFR